MRFLFSTELFTCYLNFQNFHSVFPSTVQSRRTTSRFPLVFYLYIRNQQKYNNVPLKKNKKRILSTYLIYGHIPRCYKAANKYVQEIWRLSQVSFWHLLLLDDRLESLNNEGSLYLCLSLFSPCWGNTKEEQDAIKFSCNGIRAEIVQRANARWEIKEPIRKEGEMGFDKVTSFDGGRCQKFRKNKDRNKSIGERRKNRFLRCPPHL